MQQVNSSVFALRATPDKKDDAYFAMLFMQPWVKKKPGKKA